jgi:hypothetical protein
VGDLQGQEKFHRVADRVAEEFFGPVNAVGDGVSGEVETFSRSGRQRQGPGFGVVAPPDFGGGDAGGLGGLQVAAPQSVPAERDGACPDLDSGRGT